MQQEHCKEKHVKKKKARTWTEAAKLVLEMFPKTPMTHKEIFGVVRSQYLKDVSGPASLACLNAMLHAHSRGAEAMFYRVAGSNSVFGLTSDIPECATRLEVEEDESNNDDESEEDNDEAKNSNALKLTKSKKEKVLYVKFPSGYKPPSYPVVNLEAGNLLTSSGCDRLSASQTGTLQDCSLTTRSSSSHLQNGLWREPSEITGNGSQSSKWSRGNSSSTSRGSSKALTLHLTLPSTDSGISPVKLSRHNHHHQKAVKHALRQQQKRRRRNTAIAAAGGSSSAVPMAPPPPPAPLPRIIMKPLVPPQTNASSSVYTRRMVTRPSAAVSYNLTLLSSESVKSRVPSSPSYDTVRRFKPRKRNQKKLSTAAQIAQTKKGCIDLETPDSILVHTDLRALLNKHTFNSLPQSHQYRLTQLLPPVDRHVALDNSVRLSPSALSNEFFAFACQEWWERLSEGEFTHENQLKRKWDEERERSKLDPWKIKYFEPIWGQKTLPELPDPPKSTRLSSISESSSNTRKINKPLSRNIASSERESKSVPSIKIKPLLEKSQVLPTVLARGTANNLISAKASITLDRCDLLKPGSPCSSSSSSSSSSSTDSSEDGQETDCLIPELISNNPISQMEETALDSEPLKSDCPSDSTELVSLPVDENTTEALKRKMSDFSETENSNDSSLKKRKSSVDSPDQCDKVVDHKPERSSALKNSKEIPHSSRHKTILRTTFTATTGLPSNQPIVPPITIRSIPVISSHRSGSKTVDGVNVERSYQICQAVLESSKNRSNFTQSGPLGFKAKNINSSSSSPVSVGSPCRVDSPSPSASSINSENLISNNKTCSTVLSRELPEVPVHLENKSSPSPVVDINMQDNTPLIVPSSLSTISTPEASCNSSQAITSTEDSNALILMAQEDPPTSKIETLENNLDSRLSGTTFTSPIPPVASDNGVPCSGIVKPESIIVKDYIPIENKPKLSCAVTSTLAFSTVNTLQISSSAISSVIPIEVSREDISCTSSPQISTETPTPCHTPQAIYTDKDCSPIETGSMKDGMVCESKQDSMLNKLREEDFLLKKVMHHEGTFHQEHQGFEPVVLPDGTIPVLVVQEPSSLGNILQKGGAGGFQGIPVTRYGETLAAPQRPQSEPVPMNKQEDLKQLQRSASVQDFNTFGIPVENPGSNMHHHKSSQYSQNSSNIPDGISTLPTALFTSNLIGNSILPLNSNNNLAKTDNAVNANTSSIHGKNLSNHSLLYSSSGLQNSLGPRVFPSGGLPVSMNNGMFSPSGFFITHSGHNHQYHLNGGNRNSVTVVPSIPPYPVMSVGYNYSPTNGVTLVSPTLEDRARRNFVATSAGVLPHNNNVLSGVGIPPTDTPSTNGSNCACNLKALVMCSSCGAFCHDDCIGPSKLCVTCLIR